MVSDSVDSALASVDFVNVNDKTCEGLRYKNIPAVSVQFMPDAASGSSDTTFVFEDFFRAMQKA